MLRRTIVVSNRAQLDATRLELARADAGTGVRVMPIEGVAARLAGGFLEAVETETLSRAVGDVLSNASDAEIGDFAAIRMLPGMRKTLTETLRKAWHAGMDFDGEHTHSRLTAMSRIEALVLEQLLPCRMRPAALAEKAIERVAHAPAVLGTIEIRGCPDLERCWHRLLAVLAGVIPVTWNAGPFARPAWLDGTVIEVVQSPVTAPDTRTCSCASARHEVIEAFRWARELIATGRAGPHEIAFAAASTLFFDDVVLSLGSEAGLPVHFAHGRNALHTPEGQAAAALADVILRGISQERIRRLAARARAPGSPFAQLPAGWWNMLPADAPLTTPDRWRQILEAGGDGTDLVGILLPVLDVLAEGPAKAAEAGELLLRGAARSLWRRALVQAPATALDRELGSLRAAETVDAAAAIAWMPASTLASCPRAHVWLLGLNSQSWPRISGEDPLLPDRVLGGFRLEEVSLAEADRRSFEAVMRSTTGSVVRSFSRREAGGRRLGISPLVSGSPAEHLQRTRIPAHAMSEPDRLMARPEEFAAMPEAAAASICWANWRRSVVTEHDGLVRPEHPAILRALARPQSASSLTLLLRNPLGFMWTYALGLWVPEIDDEPLEMDGRDFGALVHEVLDASVTALEEGHGVAAADPGQIERTVSRELAHARARWETTRPVPPDMLWEDALTRAETLVLNALLWMPPLTGQRSYTEVPFGLEARLEPPRPLPWDETHPVQVPGTGLRLSGRIDRLDIAGNQQSARVVDYKTGKPAEGIVLRGGRELQRCLYAYAVRALLGEESEIEAALLYPSRVRGRVDDGTYAPLDAPRDTLDQLTQALADAVALVREGKTVPGIAAGSRGAAPARKADVNTAYERDDLAFALPVVPGTVLGPKKLHARTILAPLVPFWDAP